MFLQQNQFHKILEQYAPSSATLKGNSCSERELSFLGQKVKKKKKKKEAVKNMQNAFPDASEESRHALSLGQLLALGELKALVADPHVQSSENNGCL